MKLSVYTPTGRTSGSVTLPKELFGAEVNEALVTQAIKVYLANKRQKGKKVKSRGEIHSSKRKIYRQKGTGRARHGAKSAPLFVGGGVTHGPTGKENYRLKLTRAMRKKALASSLTLKLKAKEIVVVNKLETLKPKTKLMKEALGKVLKKLKLEKVKKVSLILPEPLKSVIRGAGNLPNVNLLNASQLNTYQVANGGALVILKPSLEVMKQTFIESKEKEDGKK